LIWTRLNDSLGLVEQTTEQVRDVLAELRPPILDDYGLVETLDWYAKRVEVRMGLTIGVESQPFTPRLAPPIENALFRIAQEALTNVAKYAQATQVTLSIGVEGQAVRLVVEDDGVGFEPNHTNGAAQRQGWGLQIMRERAEMVGGHCWIESHPGQGTRVIVEVRP
jgi:two-component system sensor histidine kinase UhpB